MEVMGEEGIFLREMEVAESGRWGRMVGAAVEISACATLRLGRLESPDRPFSTILKQANTNTLL
jgi:hypothetical protein